MSIWYFYSNSWTHKCRWWVMRMSKQQSLLFPTPLSPSLIYSTLFARTFDESNEAQPKLIALTILHIYLSPSPHSLTDIHQFWSCCWCTRERDQRDHLVLLLLFWPGGTIVAPRRRWIVLSLFRTVLEVHHCPSLVACLHSSGQHIEVAHSTWLF